MDNMEIYGNRASMACKHCQKEFSTASSRNRHIRVFHNTSPGDTARKGSMRITCPLCLEEEKFNSYLLLIDHFRMIHNVKIKKSVLHFRNISEFEVWRALDNRKVDYTCQKTSNGSNEEKTIYYNCNRSNSRGYKSAYHKRRQKKGGSIKMNGVCPSRFIVNISSEGSIKVTFTEPHVGHSNEIRSKHLTKPEQNRIVSEQEHLDETARLIDEPTSNEVRCQDELSKFMRAITSKHLPSDHFETTRQICLQHIINIGQSLNEEEFLEWMKMNMEFNNKRAGDTSNTACQKRKIEKRKDYPVKK